MLNETFTFVTPGILGLNVLDARNQHLLALDCPKKYASLPCGLAAELWNIIMDYLHDDKDTLIACLLACRAWGDFCRYHIYEKFNWNAQDDFDDSECLKQLHPYPHYVRHLIINGRSLDELLGTLDGQWLLPLARHLDKFKSVVHLEVESVDWDDIFCTHAWRTFCSASAFLSQIKTLDLSNIPLQPFHYIFHIICLFPTLEKLDYLPSHVDFDDENLDFSVYAPSSSWHTFSTEHAPLQLPTCGFWTWLSAATFTTLRTIRLDSVPSSDLPSLSSYLRLLGGSLEEFRIRFLSLHDICDFTRSEALVDSTGLQRLEVVGLIRQYTNDRFWVGEQSLSFLSMLPGTSLSRIDIALHVAWCQVPDSIPSHISALDKLLSTSKRFPALKRVQMRIGCGGDEEEVKQAFAQCEQKGLLAVAVWKPSYPLLALLQGQRCSWTPIIT